MDRWKNRGGKSQRGERVRRERVSRKKMKVHEKVEKSRNTVFAMFWGSGGSKSSLAKAAGAEPSGQMRNENCTLLWHEAHFQIKMLKAQQLHYTTTTTTTTLHYTRLHHTTFSSCDWGDHFNHSKKHNSNHLLVHHGFALPSMHHNTSPLL